MRDSKLQRVDWSAVCEELEQIVDGFAFIF